MATANQLVMIQISNASALVKTGDFRGAETALRKIADEEGDKALIKALSMVPPADMSQILVGTATLPSAICGNLISPADFVQALLEVPKTWLPNGKEAAHLQLQEIFCGVIMRPDEDGFSGYHASKFFREIVKSQVATELLAWYLIDKVFVTSGEDSDEDSETEAKKPTMKLHSCLTDKEYEPQDGDWDHLAFLTRRVPDLLSSLRVLWRDGVIYDGFLPSMQTLGARKSAL